MVLLAIILGEDEEKAQDENARPCLAVNAANIIVAMTYFTILLPDTDNSEASVDSLRGDLSLPVPQLIKKGVYGDKVRSN